MRTENPISARCTTGRARRIEAQIRDLSHGMFNDDPRTRSGLVQVMGYGH